MPKPIARPLLRGWSHLGAFVGSIPAAVVLVAVAGGTAARIAVVLYSVSLTAMFGVSALYHRKIWAPAGRARMRRLDHSMIFVLIAGTYTPIALLLLRGGWAVALLAIAWMGAIAGVVLKIAFPAAPRAVGASMYIALGWVAVTALVPLTRALGARGASMLVAGGVMYTAGAIVFARRSPNPFPRVFGYHEIFHAFVILASACHWLVVRMSLARAA